MKFIQLKNSPFGINACSYNNLIFVSGSSAQMNGYDFSAETVILKKSTSKIKMHTKKTHTS